MDGSKLRIIGWIAVGIVTLGQILPWGYGWATPISQVWDWLFSEMVIPQPEWWVWSLAPLAATALGVQGLMQDLRIPRLAVAPVIIFILTWAALFPTGVRRYVSFDDAGFLCTFVGILSLGALAMWKK